ncbi:beta-1,3-galactosyltransferase 1-like isoform X1 [Teleopsis dalmanni]|uniref:beta-1,3-galactosyltransferase 1-like isoform X1 n=1 Tax=Teleopsis dalmanni TaxID=139649 RepID=UPI0018CF9F55|nr:beta-1,3-galactosyltransferase 1-like isoform X1 [Teleopsis dalmanni]
MPSQKQETQFLLKQKSATPANPASVTYINSSSSDSEDDVDQHERAYRMKVKLEPTSKLKQSSSRRRRHQIHRGARRIGRIVLWTLLLPTFLFILYLPLYSDVHSRSAPLPGWSLNTSRHMPDYVLPDTNTTIIEPHNLCHEKIFILIVVCSSVQNFATRQIIRETWGNTTQFNYDKFSEMHAHLNKNYLNPTIERIKYYSEFLRIDKNDTIMPDTVPIKVVFLVGRNEPDIMIGNETVNALIHKEAQQYQDIIQEDFTDTYNNLTLKSVMALKWITKHCLGKVAFFMKSDDDTFVHVPNLIHFLLGGTIPLYNNTLDMHDLKSYEVLSARNRLNKTNNYLTGHLFCTSRPIANITSKWYMPYYMYPEDKYPRYLSGAGYMMSMDVVPRLYDMSLNTSFIYLEDVYLTGMCAEKLNIPRVHQPLFSYNRATEWCSFKGSITQHELKDDSLLDAYAFVANVSNRCRPPNKYFKLLRLRKNSNCV